RQAYYYPRQCTKCFKVPRDVTAKSQHLSAALGGMNHPRAVPLFTERIVDSRRFKYVQIKVSSTGKWPYKHRWMMERHLGRKLLASEFVHHLNGNSLDNRFENFQLVSHHEHMSAHKLTTWSRKYDRCRLCGTIANKHEAKSLCSICYRKIKAKELGHWPKPKHTGRWSKKSDCCLKCQTTERPHKGLGLCTRCYLREKAKERGYWL
ncbi:MAG: HNH endonuclease, partial [Thermodesulfobacteriota bacterium]|nr:HNH endonuclease [Thermodesulfobacteriota bacterium]